MAKRSNDKGKRDNHQTIANHPVASRSKYSQISSVLHDLAARQVLQSVTENLKSGPKAFKKQAVVNRVIRNQAIRPQSQKLSRAKLARSSLLFPSDSYKFARPERVGVCVRRHQRREVLHALKFTGKGSGGGRKPRRRQSTIRC